MAFSDITNLSFFGQLPAIFIISSHFFPNLKALHNTQCRDWETRLAGCWLLPYKC